MSVPAPTDEELALSFGLELPSDPQRVLNQAGPMGPPATPSGTAAKTRSSTNRGQKAGSAEPGDPSARSNHSSRGSGPGRRSRGGSSRGRNKRPEPRRNNQISQLSSSLLGADEDGDTEIPDVDAVNSRTIEEMSNRSSYLEETVEGHDKDLQSANARIRSLETENSLLVSRINNMDGEITEIKEIIGARKTAGFAQANNNVKVVAKKPGLPETTNLGSTRNSSVSLDTPSDVRAGQQLDTDMVSRPISKKKRLE